MSVSTNMIDLLSIYSLIYIFRIYFFSVYIPQTEFALWGSRAIIDW